MPHRDACFAEPDGDVEGYATLWEAIRAEPDQPWDYWKLSEHPELPWEIVMALPHKSWHWHRLSSHPQLTFDSVRSLSDKDWDWGAVSEHPNISLETIAAHPDYFWKFREREVPFEILIKLPRYKKYHTDTWFAPWAIVLCNPTMEWDWERLSQRGDLTWETVLKHPDLPWHWNRLTQRRHITIDIVQSLPDKPWGWKDLTHCLPKGKLFQWLEAFPHQPWDFHWISLNFTDAEINWPVFWQLTHPNPTSTSTSNHAWNYSALYTRTGNIDLLLRLKRIQWTFKSTCQRMKTLSWETIRACMESNRESSLTLPWKMFQRRTDVPWDYVLRFRDWPWSWWHLSLHPKLTFRFYTAHRSYPWNKSCIKARFARTAAYRIQSQWRRCVSDPSYLVCRRRLMYEFGELQ